MPDKHRMSGTPAPLTPPWPRPPSGWEHFEHGADVGVRGWAPSLAEAFAQAGRALTAVVVPLDRVRPVTAVTLTCRAADDESLFVAWLNAIVHAMAARRMLFCDFAVTVAGHRLRARARGEALEPSRHEPAVEVKGATFTALRVAPSAGGWVAQAVVDV
jgi:tRNA nucleotidyltransferase (CCA-adding enzyme)